MEAWRRDETVLLTFIFEPAYPARTGSPVLLCFAVPFLLGLPTLVWEFPEVLEVQIREGRIWGGTQWDIIA